jgi:site-specific recombinase XerD
MGLALEFPMQKRVISIENKKWQADGNSQLIADIEQAMLKELDNHQMTALHNVLSTYLNPNPDSSESTDNDEKLLMDFLAAKRVEGCSHKTLKYYESTLQNMFSSVGKEAKHITTDDLRNYLDLYHSGGAGKVTVDNVRRIFSSFFTWLEAEDYIMKSPVRRIHKVKTSKTVKETYSDETLEIMRDQSGTLRDLAIIDLLISTGIRVGELVTLDRSDIDFENRECVVIGKGDKERRVYFDARAKIHLQDYLKSRSDDNPALFVTFDKPYSRLQIGGVETRLRVLGRRLNITKVHPHKFRRTMATKAIDKGMPIEQVQQLLGHQNVDTTLRYAMVNQNNVKLSHKKFLA